MIVKWIPSDGKLYMVLFMKQKPIIAHDRPTPFWSEILYVSAKYFAIFFVSTPTKRVWTMARYRNSNICVSDYIYK